MMSARAFEQRILQAEGIRLIRRFPDAVTAEPYSYQQTALTDWTEAKWLKDCVQARIGDIQADVANPDFALVSGNTCVETLKA